MNIRQLMLAAGLVAASLGANAATINFNEFAHDDYYVQVNPVSSGGFLFTNSYGTPDSLGVWGKNSSYQADPGFASVFVNHGFTTTTMSRADNSAFSFTSIDMADVYNSGVSSTIQFTFNYAAGGSSTRSVTLDNQRGLQTFVFNDSGLSSVSWKTTSGDGGWNQFDNIVTAPVPEPETYAMLLAGFGVLGAIARRKQKHAA